MGDRMRTLGHEVMRFGVVGGVGFVIDVVGLQCASVCGRPRTAPPQAADREGHLRRCRDRLHLSGNRHWTWEHRERSGAHREVTLFFALNGVGMLIAVGCLAFRHYVLDLRSPLADNVSANVVGLGLGMLFRFWSYRTFVFRRLERTEIPPPADDERVPSPLV